VEFLEPSAVEEPAGHYDLSTFVPQDGTPWQMPRGFYGIYLERVRCRGHFRQRGEEVLGVHQDCAHWNKISKAAPTWTPSSVTAGDERERWVGEVQQEQPPHLSKTDGGDGTQRKGPEYTALRAKYDMNIGLRLPKSSAEVRVRPDDLEGAGEGTEGRVSSLNPFPGRAFAWG